MTTETRIGLLVGLMFIIAFGLVLGELSEPSKKSSDDLKTAGGPKQVAMREVAGEAPEHHFTEERRGSSPSLAAVDPPHETIETSLQEAPSGEGFYESELVREETSPVVAMEAAAPAAAAAAGQPYVVADGDTLRKIARKVYGRENEKYYKRIFEANREVLSNESVVYVGQTLVIPPLPAQSEAPAVAQARPEAPARRYQELTLEQAEQTFGRAGQRQEIRTYVVRQNDNLTKIARAELKDDSRQAVQKLFEANRDVLENPNDLRVGMKLRIPG